MTPLLSVDQLFQCKGAVSLNHYWCCGLGMAFPSLVFLLTHSKLHATGSFLFHSPSPVAGWRGEFEAQKVNIRDWDKSKLLKTAMKLKKNTLEKTVAVTISNMNPNNTQPLPPPHYMTQKGPLSPPLGITWGGTLSYPITSGSCPCPSWLLQQLTLSLARTRTNGDEQPLAMPYFQSTSGVIFRDTCD